jgi:hypothetical protein
MSNNRPYTLPFTGEEVRKKLNLIPTPATDKPETISCIFAENDWDTIAWVSQYDDPSKYWRVGDYKSLTIPGKKCIVKPLSFNSLPLFFMGSGRPTPNKIAEIQIDNVETFAETLADRLKNSSHSHKWGDKIYITPAIMPKNQKYTFCNNSKSVEFDCLPCMRISLDAFPIVDNFENVFVLGNSSARYTSIEEIQSEFSKWGLKLVIVDTANFTLPNISSYGVRAYAPSNNIPYQFLGDNPDDKYTTITYEDKEYPCTILGFNHDDVYDTYSYGKSKAGMTLCIGVSRGNYQGDKTDRPPYSWEPSLNTNLYESQLGQFEACLGTSLLLSPYFKGNDEPWAYDISDTTEEPHTQFYDVLQELLDETAISGSIVKVLKMTAAGPYQPNQNYTPTILSADKISLLSENEVQGKLYYAAIQEGEQYEFFKRGYSKFFWNSLITGTDPQLTLINLLSRSKVARSDVDGTDYNKAEMKLVKDCCCLQNNSPLTLTSTLTNSNISINSAYTFVYSTIKDYYLGEFEVSSKLNANNNYDITIKKDGKQIKLLSNVKSSKISSNSYGITVTGEGTIKFNITRSATSVSYNPGKSSYYEANVGVLLPIFCL